MNLHDEIKTLADAEGIDFFGVADITPARGAIVHQGGDELARFGRAISIGKTLAHAIVDGLTDPPDTRGAQLYQYYCYDLVNDLLDTAALRMSSLIQAHGYAALPIPAAPRAVDRDRLCGVFSNKLAAHLAGLGWIGKSCLLITPEAGPRARWASVLTDAPIEPTGQPMAPRCGECQVCVDACPAAAFTGRPFAAEEDRDARFRASACHEHLRAAHERIGERVCGICVKVCPHGVQRRRNK
jgi:epoxyqueuosine reductase